MLARARATASSWPENSSGPDEVRVRVYCGLQISKSARLRRRIRRALSKSHHQMMMRSGDGIVWVVSNDVAFPRIQMCMGKAARWIVLGGRMIGRKELMMKMI